jgi:hypothetical protein
VPSPPGPAAALLGLRDVSAAQTDPRRCFHPGRPRSVGYYFGGQRRPPTIQQMVKRGGNCFWLDQRFESNPAFLADEADAQTGLAGAETASGCPNPVDLRSSSRCQPLTSSVVWTWASILLARKVRDQCRRLRPSAGGVPRIVDAYIPRIQISDTRPVWLWDIKQLTKFLGLLRLLLFHGSSVELRTCRHVYSIDLPVHFISLL